jgi:hypothetical protein
MNNYGIIHDFNLQCVDDMNHIPPQLERVPTLIIRGVNKPLVGKEVAIWFNNNRLMFEQKNSQQQKKKILYNIMKNNKIQQKGPNGFSDLEYQGLSDNFAYTDIDNPQPKAYCDYNNNTNVIFTPPQDNKLSKREQLNSMKKLEQVRMKQEKETEINMKQEQINLLIENEKNNLMKSELGI